MRKQTTTNELALYTFVFNSRISKAAVLSLFMIMCIQPVSLAYAAEDEPEATFDAMEAPSAVNEEIATDTTVAEEEEMVDSDTETVVDEPVVTESTEPEEIVEETTENETNATESEETEAVTDDAIEESVTEDDGNVTATSSTANTEDGESEDVITDTAASSTDTGAEGSAASSTDSGTESVGDTGSGGGGGSSSNADDETDDSTGTSSESGANETDTATTTEEATDESDDDTPGVESDNTEIEADDQSATSSEEVINEDPAPIYATAVNNNNFYQFSKGECVTVGDGSFYCGVTEDASAPVEDAFFAAQDSDGDLEIYARKDGQEYQITHNVFDDAAPYYDPASETIVWHRLIQDRYQIMSYDFATEKETKLTDSSVNNMEPTRFGEVTVWQRWGGDNWEIMINDGTITEQLTNNIYHDIAPSIRSGYVLWKTVYETGQQVSVYDLETGEITMINDAEASVSVSNPRMVLMYDALTDTGDVVTRGYDPATGEIIPLGVLPVELPDEMPESDQTGETRALIQTKSTVSGRENNESSNDEDEITAVPDVATSTANVVASSTDLVIPTEPVTPPLASSTESVTDTDLYIEKPVDTETVATSSATSHIPDLVIPLATTTEAQ